LGLRGLLLVARRLGGARLRLAGVVLGDSAAVARAAEREQQRSAPDPGAQLAHEASSSRSARRGAPNDSAGAGGEGGRRPAQNANATDQLPPTSLARCEGESA